MKKIPNTWKIVNPDQYTILVVDDNPSNIGIMLNYLNDLGFRILVARDGESAIHTANLSLPDLILLDVIMPGLNGFQTCQKLKEEQKLKDIPVIFLTSLTETTDIVKGFESGGVDYITKPFQSEELFARIMNHLALSALQKRLENQNEDLQNEIIKRKNAEDELYKANEILEQRVLERTNELTISNNNLTEEINEREKIQSALTKATHKLNLLNEFILHNIESQLFMVSGYLELVKGINADTNLDEFFQMQKNCMENIVNLINFGKMYSGLGLKVPIWQNVNLSILYAISHLDFSNFSRNNSFDDLEIFADPLLEKVFLEITKNTLKHGDSANTLNVYYKFHENTLILIIEDNGKGIKDDMKELIFDGNLDNKKGMSLFLVKEILSLTNILIFERGIYGKGARFELEIPEGAYRFISGIEINR